MKIKYLVFVYLLSIIGVVRGGSKPQEDWERTGRFPDAPLIFFSIACDQENNIYVGAEYVILDKEKGISMGALDTGRVFKSIDEGRHWELTGEFPDYAALDVMSLMVTKDGTIYAGTDDRDGKGGVYKSTNGGDSWKATGELPGAEPSVYSLLEGEDGTIYAGSSVRTAGVLYAAIYKSTNKGKTWARVGAGQIKGGPVVTLLELPDGTLFAGPMIGRGVADTTTWLHKSTDKGGTWERVDVYREGKLLTIYKLVYRNERLYAATSCLDSIGTEPIAAPRVFYSDSKGSSWTITNPIKFEYGESMRALLKSNKGTLYAGTQWNLGRSGKACILKSKDDFNWEKDAQFGTADPMQGICGIVQAPNGVIYAAIVGPTASVYKNLTEKEGGIEEKRQSLSTAFKTSSNPFIQTVGLRYELPTLTRVSLKAYNTSGELVKTLIDRTQALGSYRILWDGSTEKGDIAPAGVYFFELKTEKTKEVKKVVKVK